MSDQTPTPTSTEPAPRAKRARRLTWIAALVVAGGCVFAAKYSGIVFSAIAGVTLALADRPHRPWLRRFATAGAVAAGFVAVAGAYTFMRPATESTIVSQMPAPAVVARADSMPPSGSLQVVPAFAGSDSNLRLVRDARLDAYLAAHKQFAGSSSIGLPVYVRPTVDSSASAGR